MNFASTGARATFAVVLTALTGCTDLFETPASRQIERAGVAVTKSSGPGSVMVFVPQTTAREEAAFGDEQLLSIIGALRELPDLGILNLSGSSVTDRSVSELGKVPVLQEIYVQGTKVSVGGLASLGKCPSLREVQVGNGQFSTAESLELRQSLQGVEVLDLMQ